MDMLLAIWKSETMTVPESLGVAVVGILIVLAELALLAVFIIILSKLIGFFTSKRKGEPQPDPVASPVPAGVPLPDTQSEGTLDLINVDEPTAAAIMAIVSNESGIPLNRLSFKSIKLLEDK